MSRSNPTKCKKDKTKWDLSQQWKVDTTFEKFNNVVEYIKRIKKKHPIVISVDA